MVKTTAFMPMVLADMTLGVVSDRFTIAIPVKVLTKATAERTSSRPRPIPRILPANRKATVMANKTHSTAMAMSESRALPVMGKGSVFVSMIAGDKAAGDAKTMEGMIASKQQGSRNFWRHNYYVRAGLPSTCLPGRPQTLLLLRFRNTTAL
jgi:hypothetical protein